MPFAGFALFILKERLSPTLKPRYLVLSLFIGVFVAHRNPSSDNRSFAFSSLASFSFLRSAALSSALSL